MVNKQGNLRQAPRYHDPLSNYRPEIVGYLGPDDSFSGIIAHKLFHPDYAGGAPNFSIGFEPKSRLRDVIDRLRANGNVVGILPVENKLTTPVHEVTDALLDGDLHVLGESWMQVRLVVAGTARHMGEVTTIYSYTKALDQAKNFISEHELEVVEVDSTSAAADIVKKSNEPTIAALCSMTAARVRNLKVYRPSVQDEPDNKTRFLAVQAAENSKTDPKLSWLQGKYKGVSRAKVTGIISPTMPTHDYAWLNVAGYFRSRNVLADDFVHRNTQIEPAGGDRDHFVELIGHPNALWNAVGNSEAQRDLERFARFKLLGVYPMAVHEYAESESGTYARKHPRGADRTR